MVSGRHWNPPWNLSQNLCASKYMFRWSRIQPHSLICIILVNLWMYPKASLCWKYISRDKSSNQDNFTMDTFVQSEVNAVSRGRALILPKSRVQLFGDPEIEKNKWIHLLVGTHPKITTSRRQKKTELPAKVQDQGWKKKRHKLDKIPHH